MIVCTLDGKVAYPLSSDKIKITYENQYIKDSGSYTYDITFPLAIAANREIFKNVQRLDVKKTIADFETCRLYAGNRLIISGKGTVTSITNDKVKVQIVGGKSRIKYNSKFEKHFIDEIDYPDIVFDTGIDTDSLMQYGYKPPYKPVSAIWGKGLFVDLSKDNFVGQKGVAVFSPVNDETNEVMANRIAVMKKAEYKANGQKHEGNFRIMYNMAPQPYVLYILKKVMEYEGYSITKDDFDKDPWNRLVIVSACKTGKIKDALPHWTVYKFIDELRKFFNASFVFDETKKTVSITATNELLTNDVVTYDSEDDFSVEHDDDGLDNLATSNIEYNFDDSANRDFRDYIPQSVFKNYDVKTYGSVQDLETAAKNMTERERRTTIFKVNFNYYIWAELPVNADPDSDKTEVKRTICGLFNPIIRDIDSDDSQQLNICPAAMFQHKNYYEKDGKKKFWNKVFDAMGDVWIVMPSVTNEKEVSMEDMEEDDDGEYYYTVQNAIEGSIDEISTTEESDDARMPVAFQANCVLNTHSKAPVKAPSRLDGEDTDYRIPLLYTDYRMYPSTRVRGDNASLSLEFTPASMNNPFGGHAAQRPSTSSRFSTATIDKNNLITIKFITDDIPNPSKIYIFHNKRYICAKVELNVSDDGIDREKTGYFYEIL